VLFPQLLLILLLLPVCVFAPGFFFVRRLPWSGLEKLCGSIALSLILLWLGLWGVYVFAPGLQTAANFGLAAICGAAAIFVWRDARALFAVPRVRRAAGGYAFLLAWTVSILAIIRLYTGGFWLGDWVEHFQRTLFFLHHFPAATPIYGDYILPARPPMMNMVASLFLGVTDDRFEIFQVVFTFLNLLLFLPCCLAIPLVARVRKVRVLPLVAIFAMNPAIMENATYTWTKSLTAFYVIFAVCLYLAGWRKRDWVRMTAAFVALTAGLLVHYSAGPYVVFFALHYLIVVFRARPNRWKELAAIGATCTFLLAGWFGWSLATYGTHSTVASNSTLTPQTRYQGSTAVKIAGNLFDTLVPAIVKDPAKVWVYGQPHRPGMVRDVAFGVYQTNAIFMMGLIGGLLVVWFLFQAFRGGKWRSATGMFWLSLILFSLVFGVALSGERDEYGVAHVTMLPMEALGLTLLAAHFVKRRAIALAILAGCAVDFALGVFLQARIEHLENTPERQYYSGLGVKDGQFKIGLPGPNSLSRNAWRNWFNKHQMRVCGEWLEAEEQFRPGDPLLAASRPMFRGAMREKLVEDDKYWHGWYRTHGGEITYLGDWFGDSDIPSVLLALAAIGLLWKLAAPAPVAPVVSKRAPPVRRKR
jgi:hypothetical protein